MSDGEKDPAQCQIYRDAEREFKRQIDGALTNIRIEENNLNSARNEHSKLSSELYELQKNEIISIPLLLTPGRIGSVLSEGVGFANANSSVQIAYLESQIRELEPKINKHEYLLKEFRDKKIRLEYDIQNNAAQMNNLNCATD